MSESPHPHSEPDKTHEVVSRRLCRSRAIRLSRGRFSTYGGFVGIQKKSSVSRWLWPYVRPIAEASDVVPLPDLPRMWMRLGSFTLRCRSFDSVTYVRVRVPDRPSHTRAQKGVLLTLNRRRLSNGRMRCREATYMRADNAWRPAQANVAPRTRLERPFQSGALLVDAGLELSRAWGRERPHVAIPCETDHFDLVGSARAQPFGDAPRAGVLRLDGRDRVRQP
jgi:hypothetical protein